MTSSHTYGTSTHSMPELARIVEERLGLTFEEHDSYYRGVYLTTGHTSPTRIEIQPNAISGGHGEDDLYLPEHPAIPLLLIAIEPEQHHGLTDHLSAIHGLMLLQQERT
ncbi:hypothetical protein E1262_27245 [Jiangella aurantiaca]|uniref:Uncharacterized protein n=1 Tax=Jiangella aurantiaca TaxID=2530373 RepID=A0A4R5A1X4_9ACTN|nr:hypothetical protein [Jiangella aurantiaca]TDD64786.1 hypothetical protein E1262_27245 [Jiangella aurantiaca]